MLMAKFWMVPPPASPTNPETGKLSFAVGVIRSSSASNRGRHRRTCARGPRLRCAVLMRVSFVRLCHQERNMGRLLDQSRTTSRRPGPATRLIVFLEDVARVPGCRGRLHAPDRAPGKAGQWDRLHGIAHVVNL